MARLCKRGHNLDEVGTAANGQCRICRRENDAAWQRQRYDRMTEFEHNGRLLRARRQKALKRRELRAQQED